MPKEIKDFYKGSLHLFIGGMKGGKTDRLIQNLNKIKYSSKKYQVFTPEGAYRKELYKKYNLSPENIVSRNGNYFSAEIVKDNDSINIINSLKKTTEIVAIEEIMIFNNPDEVIEVINYLIDKKDVCVIGSGLTLDFRGKPFRPICDLLPYAKVEELYGVCEHVGKDGKRCDKDGIYPQRIINNKPAEYGSPLIQVGDHYMIKCRKHHELPGKPISGIEKMINGR